jgi:hypothetical protein
MTPVDALDTMYLMGMKAEADRTREYITANLKFDKDIYVQNFEITIRLLGGLLSAYQITGDKSCSRWRTMLVRGCCRFLILRQDCLTNTSISNREDARRDH